MVYRVGLSTNGDKLDDAEQFFKNCRDSGIGAVEISLEVEKMDALDTDWVCALAKRYGVEVWSLHLPFMPFDTIDISSENEQVRLDTLKYFTDLIARASKSGIRHFVIHPSAEPIKDDRRSACMSQSKKSLAQLAETAAKYDSVIAVEDLPRSCLGNCSDDLLELLSADDRLRVCFDTNHLLGEPIADFIRKVGDKIITLHVSDYDFVNERHWLPGEGSINWHELADELEKVGYNGPWLYEIRFKCTNTIVRDRDLTCADFVTNANELFERRPFTVIGSPKPNLGFWG